MEDDTRNPRRDETVTGRQHRRAGGIAASAALLVGGFAGTVIGPPLAAQLNASASKPGLVRAQPPPAPATPGRLFRPSPSKPRYVPGRLLVKFDDGTSAHAEQRALDRAGVEDEGTVRGIGVEIVDIERGNAAAAATALKASPAVEYVERDIEMQPAQTIPNDTLWKTQWGLRTMHAPAAWDRARGSASVVVAVLDTGVDSHHPDLQGSLVAGYDFVNGDADPSDDHGHGTAAAGVIAARTNNAEGSAGLCWHCSLMPVKVLAADGNGTTSSVAAGIVWAADHGARVINLSLGGPGTTQTLTDAIAYAVSRGAIIVGAAGNAGVSDPFYPAAYADAISVAATSQDGQLYEWSNRGGWVGVAAPGCNTAPRLGGGYVEFCGTSSAAPLVAGLVGLAVAIRPDIRTSQLKAALAASALPFSDAVRDGRVDAAAFLQQIAPRNTTVPTSGVRPTVRGPARVGAVLRASSGTWLGAPTGYAYSWERCNDSGSACRGTGASGPAYRVRPDDQGLRLRVLVAATSGAGSGTAASELTLPIRGVGRAAPPRPDAAPTNVETSAIPAGPLVGGPVTRLQLGQPSLPPSGALAGQAPTPIDGAESAEPPIVAEINRVRTARGLAPVAVSAALNRSADVHARSMAFGGYFSHDWADGTPFGNWIKRFYPNQGYEAWGAGENLLWGPPRISAKAAVAAWLGSPPHRKILLGTHWREVGVGVVGARQAPGVYGGQDVAVAAAHFGVRG